MKNLYQQKKFIPYCWGFGNSYKKEDFYCYWGEGVYDKYGLHYTIDLGDWHEEVHLKGKRYGKPPFAFDTYEEMMEQTEKRTRTKAMVEDLGDIRKEAVYLLLDLDEDGNLVSDPMSFEGFVSKRGTVFNITSDGTYDGKKRFTLTQENKYLVFPDNGDEVSYIREKYGHWAASHYIKNRFPFV